MKQNAHRALVLDASFRSQPAPDRRRQDPLKAFDALAVITEYSRGEEIYGPNDPAEQWYRVLSGMARKCAIRADGQRQIVDFLLPGDFFGFNARHVHRFAVEAQVEATLVARFPRQRIELLADTDPRLARQVREMAFEAILRAQRRMLILGRMSALEKVGIFLVEMAERASDGTADGLVLWMSRYDIADYLALAGETVSRALTELQHRGAIRLEGTHRVRIVDRSALEEDGGWR